MDCCGIEKRPSDGIASSNTNAKRGFQGRRGPRMASPPPWRQEVCSIQGQLQALGVKCVLCHVGRQIDVKGVRNVRQCVYPLAKRGLARLLQRAPIHRWPRITVAVARANINPRARAVDLIVQQPLLRARRSGKGGKHSRILTPNGNDAERIEKPPAAGRRLSHHPCSSASITASQCSARTRQSRLLSITREASVHPSTPDTSA